MERPDDVDEQTWSQLTTQEKEAIGTPDDADEADKPVDDGDPPATPAPAPADAAPPLPTDAPPATPEPAAPAPEAPAPVLAAVAEPAPVEPPPAPPATPAAPAARAPDPFEPPEIVLTPTHDADRKAAQDEIAALAKKHDEGELSTTEFLSARDEQTAKIAALDRQADKVVTRREERERYFAIVWTNATLRFFAEPANAALYPVGSEARAEFDSLVKELGSTPRFASMADDDFLRAIDKRVRPMFATATPPAAPAPATPATPAAPAPPVKGRAPNLKDVPKTLSEVPPAGDPAGVGGGEFASLDGLEGEEFVRALAALSPAQRERYERA